jgi:hypothetical protein
MVNQLYGAGLDISSILVTTYKIFYTHMQTKRYSNQTMTPNPATKLICSLHYIPQADGALIFCCMSQYQFYFYVISVIHS